MNVLLTGAGGFIGAALLQHLSTGAHQVRAVYRSALPAAGEAVGNSLGKRTEWRQGDLQNEHFCAQACAGQDVVIHLAGQAYVQGSHAAHSHNTFELTRKLAEAACAQQVSTFIYISSTKANYPRHSAYAQAKRACEEYLLGLHAQRQINVVCLRPALVYGPGMRGNLATLLRLLQRKVLPAFPASVCPLGMISLDDCCLAIVASIGNATLAGRCWELNDGQAYSLDTLVRHVRASLGYGAPWLRLPRFSIELVAQLAEFSAPLTGSTIGRGTCRALYEEPYQLDNSFAAASGFTARHTLLTELPALLME